MSNLLESVEIELLEKDDISNPVYLLNGNARFYNTEYKIMGNDPVLLPCYKATLNGRTELVYLTEKYIPLSVILSQLSEDDFLSIAIKLCESIRGVAENGFLNWQHVDLDKDRIFIDPGDRSVHLVYMPIEGVYIPPGLIDKEIRSFVAELTRETRNPDAQKMSALRNHVHSEDESLQAFVNKLNKLLRSKVSFLHDSPKGRMLLRNEEYDHTIIVDKPRFVIGKKAGAVDGVITYSKFVGRIHCQIMNLDDNYYIMDLESKNGTFVNDMAIEKGKSVLLKEGDRLKIANVCFKVDFEEV